MNARPAKAGGFSGYCSSRVLCRSAAGAKHRNLRFLILDIFLPHFSSATLPREASQFRVVRLRLTEKRHKGSIAVTDQLFTSHFHS